MIKIVPCTERAGCIAINCFEMPLLAVYGAICAVIGDVGIDCYQNAAE